jgi:hypothetical protein
MKEENNIQLAGTTRVAGNQPFKPAPLTAFHHYHTQKKPPQTSLCKQNNSFFASQFIPLLFVELHAQHHPLEVVIQQNEICDCCCRQTSAKSNTERKKSQKTITVQKAIWRHRCWWWMICDA